MMVIEDDDNVVHCDDTNIDYNDVTETQFVGMVDEIKLELPPMGKNAQVPYCTSLCWSADGTDLYAGYTDNSVRVYNVSGSI